MLVKSMKQTPSWESRSCSVIQETPHTFISPFHSRLVSLQKSYLHRLFRYPYCPGHTCVFGIFHIICKFSVFFQPLRIPENICSVHTNLSKLWRIVCFYIFFVLEYIDISLCFQDGFCTNMCEYIRHWVIRVLVIILWFLLRACADTWCPE